MKELAVYFSMLRWRDCSDIGVSAHYVGSLGRAFNSVLKIEYADDEITGKLDYACISWKDFSLKSQLRSPWGNTEAQYKHTVDDCKCTVRHTGGVYMS